MRLFSNVNPEQHDCRLVMMSIVTRGYVECHEYSQRNIIVQLTKQNMMYWSWILLKSLTRPCVFIVLHSWYC